MSAQGFCSTICARVPITFVAYKDEIYSPDLILNRENETLTSGTFLEIKVDVIDQKFETNIYDKRDDFPFEICQYPSIESNIPDKILYNVFTSQGIRFLRVCSKLEFFLSKCKTLFLKLMLKGATKQNLLLSFKKLLHRPEVSKFNVTHQDIYIQFASDI